MYDVFWKAGVITLGIIFIGLFVGYLLDDNRANNIKEELDELEIKYGDLLLQSEYLDIFSNSSNFCQSSISKTLELADLTYEKGIKLEQYEDVNRFSDSLITEKRKYALILLRLWFHSTKLKELCSADYNTIAYFYKHYDKDLIIKTEQAVQSSLILDLQQRCGRNNILIFALPADLNISTVDFLKEQYNISQTPTIIVDEEVILAGTTTYQELESYTICKQSDGDG